MLLKMVDKRWTNHPPFINLPLCGQGHFEVIKWLHINRFEGCTTDAINYATENDHLDITDWLKSNYEGRELDSWSIASAITSLRR
jgi:hypothetical protein